MKTYLLLAVPMAAALVAGCSSNSGYSSSASGRSSSENAYSGGTSDMYSKQSASSSAAAATTPDLDRVIARWKPMPQEAARTLISKYGPPQEVTDQRLIWHNNGAWKCTELVNEEIPHDFPAPHKDMLKQTISYKVPPDKFSDLARFDGSVIAERTAGELSARCDKEELNTLALNLANDIVTGKRSVEEARMFYAQTAMEFKQGQMPEYTQRLMFLAPTGETADPDQPAAMKKNMQP